MGHTEVNYDRILRLESPSHSALPSSRNAPTRWNRRQELWIIPLPPYGSINDATNMVRNQLGDNVKGVF
ncbi:hypothetical protein BH11PLA2_BH11PLA2_10030 [soil metagenome]